MLSDILSRARLRKLSTEPTTRIPKRSHYATLGIQRIRSSEVPQMPQMPTRSHRLLETELTRAAKVVQSPTVPSEAAILDALQICNHLALSISEPKESSKELRMPDKTPTSNLLSLEEDLAKDSLPKEKTKLKAQDGIRDRVAFTAYQIVTDPKVFITPSSLSIYVTIQSVLRRPQSFPQIFDLYASKPVPRGHSSPITYRNPNPNNPKAAVPLRVANTAFEAALEAKDLPLCLNIITTSVATSAFRRAKYLRKALLPSLALALSPAAAYTLGKTFAEYSERLDPQMATVLGTAGFMTYFSMTALTAYIAITTANDQMDRVSWVVGTPLYQRWIREEERAFTDRVAQAWGFQDYLKRGEEEGNDWTNLREWIMQRGMILDNPALMEGME